MKTVFQIDILNSAATWNTEGSVAKSQEKLTLGMNRSIENRYLFMKYIY